MWMRVALGIHGKDFKDALETYDLLSQKFFTHASPTLFNAGTPRSQMSSCFLLDVEDSIKGIYENIGDCAQISKYAGGIGINVHDIRCKDSIIRGTNGKTDGIIPMLRVYNATARYVNQSSKRLGSIAVYIEPWHGDIMDWLDLRKNHGAEEERARDLFYAMWIPDLFMERVKNDEMWSLMCPDICKGLSTTYGDEFKKLYTKYESKGRFIKQIKAQTIWFKILEAQIETGTPYMAFKDAVNLKNNQQNIGTIKSSNVCSEINEFTAPDEIAVCNLASICLPMFVEYEDGMPIYNFEKLRLITKVITKNLNKIIDKNFYPVDKAWRSNMKHRPTGIGIQGLADTFIKMRIGFDSPEAKELNKKIFETIYHGSIECSMEISRKRKRLYEEMTMLSRNGVEDNMDKIKEIEAHLNLNEWEQKLSDKFKGAYSSYEGSPVSKGILQFDMWGVKPDSGLYDWDKLKLDIKENGIRNSLLVALMPTASTSQIMGNNEAFEAITSNLYKRKTLAGEFILINKYLVEDLIKLNLWNNEIREKIMINEGSVQNINEIPNNIKVLYKTVWEIKQKNIIDLSADRAPYICQAQSMNLFVAEPNPNILTKMHFYTWSKGLKTGMYYLRTRPKATTQQFTIDPRKSKSNLEQNTNINNISEPEDCINCGA
jgi:ribonucleoside-diphosphate reductase alpha chain